MTKLYAFAGVALIAALCTTQATAQSAFPANTPLAVTKPGNGAATPTYTVSSSTNTSSASAFNTTTTFTSAVDINGVGLNPIDNKLYGAGYTGTTDTPNTILRVNLYRIGANGVVANMGKLPNSGQSPLITLLNLNIRAEIVNYTAGTVDLTGKYYYTTVGLKQSGVDKLIGAYINYITHVGSTAPNLDTTDIRLFVCWINNINNLTGSNMPTTVAGYKELNFSNPAVRASVQNLLNNMNTGFPGNLATLDGGLQDFAIHPLNGKIYGYISYPSGGNLVGRPVVFAPTIGSSTTLSVITPVGTQVNTVPGVEVAGLQFDATGNFYGLFNNGTYAGISLTTGALISPVTSNLGTTGGNLRGDLASPATANVVLPVTLSSFTGRAFSNYNELNWTVGAESKLKAFVLERSSNGGDFEALATIEPQKANTYQYFDNQAPATAYYRLQMTEQDGEATYSTVVKLQNNARSSGTKVYPTLLNAGSELHIESGAQDYSVYLFNAAGQLVLQHSGNAATILRLPTSLAPGNYWLKLVNNEDKETITTEKISVR